MAIASGGAAPIHDPNLVGEHKILGLVVHGIGEETVGSTLRCVVRDFFPLIRKSVDTKWYGIHVTPVDDAGLPEARLSFYKRLQGGKYERYELRVREVHWAKAFLPPSFGSVVGGLWQLFGAWIPRLTGVPPGRGLRILWLIGTLLFRALTDLIAVVSMIILSPLAITLALLALVGGRHGWLRRLPGPGPWFLSMYARFQPSVVELAVIVASPATVALFVVLIILERIGPLAGLLPDSVTKVRRQIVSVVTSYLGDVSAYATQPWEASQIRTRFEDRFRTLVQDAQRDGGTFDAMFVIAHSLGCPVSYEALSGTKMTAFIKQEFEVKERPLYYFTVGSALPAIWAVVPVAEGPRLYRKLPEHIHWEDFYSDYDPVRSALICKTVNLPLDKITLPPAAWQHRVTNQADLFSEHTAYWNNAKEVLTPILNIITRGEFAAKLGLQ